MLSQALIAAGGLCLACSGTSARRDTPASVFHRAADAGQYLTVWPIRDTIVADDPVEIAFLLQAGRSSRRIYYFDTFLSIAVIGPAGAPIRPRSTAFWDRVMEPIQIDPGAYFGKVLDLASPELFQFSALGEYRLVLSYRYPPRPDGAPDTTRAYPDLATDTARVVVVPRR